MNIIFIKDLEIMMSIGVHDYEKLKEQRVLVNVEMFFDPYPENDDIAETVSYETITNAIMALATSRHFNLVETFAEEIAQICLQNKRIDEVNVSVNKPDIIENAGKIGVWIMRKKNVEQFPTTHQN